MKKLTRFLAFATVAFTAIVFTSGCSNESATPDKESTAISYEYPDFVIGRWDSKSFEVMTYAKQEIKTNKSTGERTLMPVQEFGVEQRFRYWEQDLENKGEGPMIDHQAGWSWVDSNENKIITSRQSIDYPLSRATYDFSVDKEIHYVLEEDGSISYEYYYFYR
jgi:hypothetical protein